jgi:hypothetical protein
MAILSDADLERLSDWVVRLLLKDDCVRVRTTRVQKPSGGWTDTPVSLPVVKSAVLDAGSPSDVVTADQIGSSVVVKRVLLPRGTDVLEDDHLTIVGITYRVIGLFDPSTYEVARRVLVRRETAGGTL